MTDLLETLGTRLSPGLWERRALHSGGAGLRSQSGLWPAPLTGRLVWVITGPPLLVLWLGPGGLGWKGLLSSPALACGGTWGAGCLQGEEAKMGGAWLSSDTCP